MIATNSVAPISGSLRTQVQKLRADAMVKREFEGHDRDVIGSLNDILDQAEMALIDLGTEEEKIQTDADLSDTGRTKAMVKAVQVAWNKLKVIEKKYLERRQAYEQESIAIHSAPQPTSDALLNAFRESEIRRKLREAPIYEQMQAYQVAAEKGWASSLRVLKDTEVFGEDSRLTNFIQRVDQERFEAKEPKRWARLKALKYSSEILQALALAVNFRLNGYTEAPAFGGKPTGHMDLGLTNNQTPQKKLAHEDQPPTTAQAFQ